MSNDFLGLVGSVVTAIVTVSGAWLKEALSQRNREQARQRVLTQVKDEIATVEAWAKAHTTLEPTAQLSQEIRDRARCDLDIIYRRLGETEPSGRRPITLHYVLARLFLRHISVTGGARVTRFVYYFFLGVLVFWGIIVFGEPRAWEGGRIFGTLFTFFVGSLPAWGFGWATLILARRHTRGTPPGR